MGEQTKHANNMHPTLPTSNAATPHPARAKIEYNCTLNQILTTRTVELQARHIQNTKVHNQENLK